LSALSCDIQLFCNSIRMPFSKFRTQNCFLRFRFSRFFVSVIVLFVVSSPGSYDFLAGIVALFHQGRGLIKCGFLTDRTATLLWVAAVPRSTDVQANSFFFFFQPFSLSLCPFFRRRFYFFTLTRAHISVAPFSGVFPITFFFFFLRCRPLDPSPICG